jgi:hypothetical protein
VYIGEGRIQGAARHACAKGRSPRDEQDRLLAPPVGLECSWVANGTWLPQQRLGLEYDLIAVHLLVLERIPPAPFLGGRGPLPHSGLVE